MSAIEELASIATALKKDLESNGETQAVLLKVVAVLENCLACPDVLSEKKVQAYFYDDFSANIIQDLSKAAYLANQDVYIALDENRIVPQHGAKTAATLHAAPAPRAAPRKPWPPPQSSPAIRSRAPALSRRLRRPQVRPRLCSFVQSYPRCRPSSRKRTKSGESRCRRERGLTP